MSTLLAHAEISSEGTVHDVPTRQQLDAFMRPGTHLLVTSHARPDGDAVGSMLAFASILDQLGIRADLVLADPVPQVYGTLPGVQRIRLAPSIDAAHYDGAVVLECDCLARTGLLGFDTLPVFNLDHHLTGTAYGALNWIDDNACAVAVLVFRLAQCLHINISPAMATCLYTAVFTDTGAFTYPGTASSSFPIASALIALGADADTVAQDILYSLSPAHIRLLGIALLRIQMSDAVAWSYVTQQDLAVIGATDEDSENTITYLISIVGVQAALFLRELPMEPDAPRRFRISLRSKAPLDVSVVAATCGGGGHRTAAGCVLSGDLEDTVTKLLAEIKREQQRVVALM